MKITERDKAVSIRDVSIVSGGNADENIGETGEGSSVVTWSRVESKVKRNVENRIGNIVAQMTLEEKVGQMVQAEIGAVTPEEIRLYDIGSVLNGGGSHPNGKTSAVSDWVALADRYFDASTDVRDGGVGIPIIWGTDAVHGHNNVMGATIFPHNIGLGAMNNAELVEEIGKATALEVAATGVDWAFAPVVAVIRDDRWGRSYEGYAEDPELVREYAHAMIEGLQGEGGTGDLFNSGRIVATAKHFIGDGGTMNGIDQGNTDISEEDLRDIHGAGYFSSIEAGVQTVMATFNSWQGDKVHGSKYLLTTVLKEQMNFDGFVIGDWNGHAQVPGCSDEQCAAAINAGVDMVMAPYSWKAFIQNTIDQVTSGEIPITRVDDAVTRILRVKTRAGLLDAPTPSERTHANATDLVGNENHRKLARQAVRESLILLKNRNGLLPLNPNSRVLVTGGGADNIAQQSGGWTLSWQGTGNSNDDFPNGTSIYDGIKQAVESAGGSVELSIDGSFLGDVPEVAIAVFGETPYAEGAGDLSTLEYQPGYKGDLAMLQNLSQQGISVVTIFLSGRPMLVNAELNASDAFVAAWLPGTEGGGIADVIFKATDLTTKHDFSGKLSFSWPKRSDQVTLNRYDVDYDPLFSFGFGLNYSDIDALGELDTSGVLDLQTASSFSVPGIIEAEHYSNMSGVQIESTSDVSGGSNVGYLDPGDWVEYRIDVVEEGNYIIEYRLSSFGGSDGFVVRFDNENIDSQTVRDTGGWQDWVTQTSQIRLAAGQNILRLNAVGGGWNINWIRILDD
ncbi:MAG: 1,4-beta-D-glucan glucohydrolase [Porticoccaceae bacterium]|nr:1,4-beta-D-glucan glucohydrolase [Porticoccaceae bacterium]